MRPVGDSLQVWDPTGRHLHYSPGRGPAKGAAKSYRHVGSSLPSRFADQYAPWAFGGDAVERNVNGTLLRLALRGEEGSATGVAGVSSETSPRGLYSIFFLKITPNCHARVVEGDKVRCLLCSQ